MQTIKSTSARFYSFILHCIIGLSLFASYSANAQDTLYKYLDRDGLPCTREDASYLCKHYRNKASFIKYTTFFRSKKPVSKVTYLDETMLNRHGLSTYYHPNGNKSAEGFYQDNLPVGEWIYWHENGKIKTRGNVSFGDRTGKWIYYNEAENLEAVVTYAADTIVNFTFFNIRGDTLKPISLSNTPDSAGIQHHYMDAWCIGKKNNLYSFFSKNIKTPAIKYGESAVGLVSALVMISPEGSVMSPILFNDSAHPTLNQEVARVIKLLPVCKNNETNQPLLIKVNIRFEQKEDVGIGYILANVLLMMFAP